MSLENEIRTNKAEILVLSNEIEISLVKASTQVIEDESAALAKCFEMSANEIEVHIHPYQQFASTLYQSVDRVAHLDIVFKMGEV